MSGYNEKLQGNSHLFARKSADDFLEGSAAVCGFDTQPKGFILFLLPICILALFLSACPGHFNLPEDTGFGKLTVTLSAGNPRTVFPAMAFDNYVYLFTKNGETTGVELTPDSDGNFTLETGDWTVTVDAYVGTAVPANLAASGTSGTFTITANSPTTVTVRLAGNVSVGTGAFTLTITIPDSSVDVDILSLEKLPIGENLISGYNRSPNALTISVTLDNVPAGYYLLTVRLKYGKKEAGLIETVHIYDKLATSYIKTFNAADFIPAEFYSAAHFADWLASKPANTADTPYDAALIITSAEDIDGFNTQFIINGKYVSLDLSGSTITTILGSAFQNCATLTGVTLPNSVKTIGQNAFQNCTSLTAITLPAGVETIGASAFSGCTALTAITIPDTVTSIGPNAFAYTGLTSVTIPAGVMSIGDNAFSYCTALTSVTFEGTDLIAITNTSAFPEDLVTASGGTGAFNRYGTYRREPGGLTWTKVETFAFPDDGAPIGGIVDAINAWLGTKPANTPSTPYYIALNMESGNFLTIRDDVLKAAANAVKYVNIDLSGSPVTSIPANAFDGCAALTGITLPDGVTAINNSVFWDCVNLTSVTIPDSVSTIGINAFRNCAGLTAVTIPDSVRSIGDRAFQGCAGLTAVAIPGSVISIGTDAFRGCAGLTAVTIGEGVRSIAVGMFYDCTGLTAVTIPGSVISIGTTAFNGCSNLTGVTFEGTIPSTGFSPTAFSSGIGDLRDKFYEADADNGTPGTYTRPSAASTAWTKEP